MTCHPFAKVPFYLNIRSAATMIGFAARTPDFFMEFGHREIPYRVNRLKGKVVPSFSQAPGVSSQASFCAQRSHFWGKLKHCVVFLACIQEEDRSFGSRGMSEELWRLSW